MRRADLKIGGESASNMQLQLIGDPAYPIYPVGLPKLTGTPESTVADFGANGIIGVSLPAAGLWRLLHQSRRDRLLLFANGTTRTGVAMFVANQLANPVTLFDVDNNGAVLTFPTVPETGAATLSGTLTFGVGTQANNALW